MGRPTELEPVEGKDVLADHLDLPHGELLGPVPRVGGQVHRLVPEAHLLEAVPGEVLRSYYFWGTPDDVVERLRGFRAAGLEHVDLVNVSALGDPAVAPVAAARTLEVMQGLRALR